jgi:MFS family permease
VPEQFRSKDARSAYLLVTAATFMFFVPVSMNALLVNVFDRSGFSHIAQGVILSAYAIPLLVGNKLLDFLSRYYQRPRILLLALLLSIGANLLLAADDSRFLVALCARVGHGVAIGLFVPAAMHIVQAQLQDAAKKTLFGLFTAMMPLPATFGPWLGELLLRHYSHPVFFVTAALPSMAAVCVVFIMASRIPCEEAQTPATGTRPGVHDAKDRPEIAFYDLFLISAMVFIIGILSCLTGTYLGAVLVDSGVATWRYFSFSIFSLLLVRFFGLRLSAKWNDSLTVSCGLLVMLAACVAVFKSPQRFAVASGIVYGIAQGIVMPTLALAVNRTWQIRFGKSGFVFFELLFNLAYLALPLLFMSISLLTSQATVVFIMCAACAIFVLELLARALPQFVAAIALREQKNQP